MWNVTLQLKWLIKFYLMIYKMMPMLVHHETFNMNLSLYSQIHTDVKCHFIFKKKKHSSGMHHLYSSTYRLSLLNPWVIKNPPWWGSFEKDPCALTSDLAVERVNMYHSFITSYYFNNVPLFCSPERVGLQKLRIFSLPDTSLICSSP